MGIDVEELRGLWGDERGGLIVWTTGGWVAAELDELIDEGSPTEHHNPHGWTDSIVRLQMYAPNPPEGWATGMCELICKSDEGEWQDAKLWWGEEHDGDGYPDLDESAKARYLEPVSRTRVNDEREVVVEEMAAALGARVSSTGTFERAVLASSVVRASARTG